MKKNFMAIASLLIAAMLLMVSCSQEVKAPENNGLVKAKLSVGYGRDLDVSGDTNTSEIVLKYTMEPLWNIDGASEVIHGKKDTKTPFTDNGTIGYVTPGLWEVKVFAYEKDKATESDKTIFEGTANAYFSNQNSSVTVYLAPTSSQNNTLNFEITMQDLVGTGVAEGNTGKGSFKLVYSVYDTTGTIVDNKNKVVLSEKTLSDTNGDEKNDTTTYKGSTTLASGFYRVNVSIISVTKNEEGQDVEKTVGGISKGFLLSGGKIAKISGHIEPSDYENVIIDAFYIDVKTKITANTVSYTAAEDSSNSAKAAITLTVSDNGTTGNKGTITPSYIWYVANTETTEYTSTNAANFTVTFKAPGYKNISCQTIYSVDVDGETYSFADFQTVQVYVDPLKFGTTENVTVNIDSAPTAPSTN